MSWLDVDVAKYASFPPVVNEQTHTLILGSFPGVASLNLQEYYAFRQNQFWTLLSQILELDLRSMNYQDRLASLLNRGVGLWDVYQTCVRIGSLDSAIKQAQRNDFAGLMQACPHLRRVCFNGQTAAKAQSYFVELGMQTLVLPSSSPAHASLSLAQKLVDWRKIL